MPSISLNPFSGVLWDRREPFKQLWITLSGIEHSKNKEKKKKEKKRKTEIYFQTTLSLASNFKRYYHV